MNEELLSIYKERLAAFDPALVPEAAAAYFGDLFAALSQTEGPVGDRKDPETDLGELSPVLGAWRFEALSGFPQKEEALLRILETSIRLLCAFEEAYAERSALPEEKTLRDIVWSYLHDYALEFTAEYFAEGAPSSRLFITGDPLWGPLSGRTGDARIHAGDLSLFWGDRLKAAKLAALEETVKAQKAAGRKKETFPALSGPSFAEDAALSFTGRQKNLFSEYAEKAEKIYEETI